jgi:iron-sulfur cluster repair protein YtfE (RIC family)
MNRTVRTLPTTEIELAAVPIRDLTEIEPRVLELLGAFGIDLCCGGAHPLGEALDLHGIDRSSVMPGLLALANETRE